MCLTLHLSQLLKAKGIHSHQALRLHITPGHSRNAFSCLAGKDRKSWKRGGRGETPLSSGLTEDTGQQVEMAPFQSAAHSPGSCLGLGGVDVGLLGAKEGQRMKATSITAPSFHPAFLHLL